MTKNDETVAGHFWYENQLHKSEQLFPSRDLV
jgi:hypothetical protein